MSDDEICAAYDAGYEVALQGGARLIVSTQPEPKCMGVGCWDLRMEAAMSEQFKEVPDGYVLLQRHNGRACYAACMAGQFAGWLMWKHTDGQWVSKRKLQPWELMQVEDQRDDNIVQETNSVRAG